MTTGRTVDINAFTAEVNGFNEVPIIDVILAYNYPRSRKVFLLVEQNFLYVESIENNLIPSFFLREEDLHVKNVLKIHWTEEITEDFHTIQEWKSGLFIPLFFQGSTNFCLQ